MDGNGQVLELLTDIKESLERQFHSLETKIDGLSLRFDNQAARLDRQWAEATEVHL